MPIFQYRAVKPSGEVVRGILQGTTMEDALKNLQKDMLTVQEITLAPNQVEQPGPPPTLEPRTAVETHTAALVSPVTLPQLQFFFRQLAAMLHAGINPTNALDTLSRQTQSPRLRQILIETRDGVSAGKPISAGFERYPEVFTPLMMAMIRTGEEGGFLEEQCMHLAEYLQQEHELRNLIKRETAYPKIVLVASIIIILAANSIISAVAPGHGGLSSPLTTLATWFVLGPLLVFIFLFNRIGMKMPAVLAMVQNVGLKVPWLGGMIHGFAMAKFGRSFSSLYKAGVPTRKAIQLAADACGNEVIRQQIYPAADMIETGTPIGIAFAQTGAFSQIVLEMAHTGEMTGNIDLMLRKVAEYYEDEGKTKARQAAAILGVVVFLAVAAYVGFIVISFYTGMGATSAGQMSGD